MGEYEIDQVVWHEMHQRIEAVYVDRESDHIVASERIATMLADDAGLIRPGIRGDS